MKKAPTRMHLSIIVLVLVLTSCNKDEIKQDPFLSFGHAEKVIESLSADGGSFNLTVSSSYTLWKVWAKGALEGQDFITEITPSFGGSAEEESVATKIKIKFKANPNAIQNRQELYLQALDGGQNRLSDTVLVLIQEAGTVMPTKANLSPTWYVEERNFLDGPAGDFDEIAVKDPSIVYHEGKYHLFFTGRDATQWRTGYASAATLPELVNADHIFLGALNGGGYFCAPQVLWFEPQGKWYLVYQSGSGATFSTNSDIANPDGWAPGKAMGFGDGIDFWVVSDGKRMYCFYSAQDGSRSIKRRSTSLEDFPLNWTEPEVVATNTFEAVHVYKNKADGHFYMIVEDIARHQELWETTALGGTWNKLEENWAHEDDLKYLADHWTDQVSHVELIRSGTNELMEVDDLNHCQMLIQGVVDGDYGDYGNIPYDLGIIRNY